MGGLETPPVADPAKSETPPKPGMSVHGKKIGRPTKAALAVDMEEKRAKSIEDFSKALPGLVELPFKAIASKRGEHWLLDKPTCDQLCVALNGMMLSYLPADLGKHLPLIMFGVVLSGAVSARIVEGVKLDRKRKAEAAKRERKATADGGDLHVA